MGSHVPLITRPRGWGGAGRLLLKRDWGLPHKYPAGAGASGGGPRGPPKVQSWGVFL